MSFSAWKKNASVKLSRRDSPVRLLILSGSILLLLFILMGCQTRLVPVFLSPEVDWVTKESVCRAFLVESITLEQYNHNEELRDYVYRADLRWQAYECEESS